MIFDASTYCPELETPISATAAALRPTDRDNSMKLVSAVKLTLQIASSLVVVSRATILGAARRASRRWSTRPGSSAPTPARPVPRREAKSG